MWEYTANIRKEIRNITQVKFDKTMVLPTMSYGSGTYVIKNNIMVLRIP